MPFRLPVRRASLVVTVTLLLCANARADELRYTTSWVGNTFSGKSQWVLQDVADLYVDPDGTVFTNVPCGNRGADHNQHWKPMGPILRAYDAWSSDGRRLRWQPMLPYEQGARGHESAEPISFDVAGDFVFVAYTRGVAVEKLKYAFVKVYKLADMAFVGNLVPERELGEAGLLDLVESVRANKRTDGEYVVFLEDDAKAKVVMFRWTP